MRMQEIKKFQQSLNHARNKESQEYNKWYGITTYILFFFSFSVLGYIWEEGLHFYQTGEFVKRGTLYGPWLPIYGSGGVLVLLLLRKIFKNPVSTFFLTMFIAAVLEYGTSYVLELLKGVRWWDYSGYFMNLNGRICLEGTVLFGLGGCLIIYILAPRLGKIYNRLKLHIKIILCIILVIFFLVDMIYSFQNPNMGKGVTNQEVMEFTMVPERIL